MHSHWPEKDRLREPVLFGRKDWDERPNHPVVSTYKFCHLFTSETRRIIRTHIDDRPPKVMANGSVRDWSPLGNDPIKPPKLPAEHRLHKRWRARLNAIIKARQWADHHGVPYRFFVKSALRKVYFGQMYLLQYTKMPDAKLLNGAEMREHVLLGWAEQIDVQVQHATHPRYVLGNGLDHPDVDKHQQWLIGQIKRRSQPHFALGKFISLGLLDPALACDAFGPRIVEKALSRG